MGLWGGPWSSRWGNPEDFIKPSLRVVDIGPGVEVQFEPVEGYAQWYRTVIDDTPAGPSQLAAEGESTYMAGPYNSPDTKHIVSISALGDWADLPDEYLTTQSALFQSGRSDRIHLDITAPLGYRVYKDTGIDNQLTNWALTGIKRFTNCMPVKGHPTWGKLALSLTENTAGEWVLTLSRNGVIMCQGTLPIGVEIGEFTLEEQNSSGLSGTVDFDIGGPLGTGTDETGGTDLNALTGYLIVRWPKQYNVHHQVGIFTSDDFDPSAGSRTPQGIVRDDGQSNKFKYRSTSGLPAGTHYVLPHSVDERGNESQGVGGLDVALVTPPGAPGSPIYVSGDCDDTVIQFTQSADILNATEFTAWMWGQNFVGMAGDNTIANRSSPVSVVGNHSFVQLCTGGSFSAGLKADGSVWAWGLNTNGQLGQTSIFPRSSPVSVIGGHSFIEICTGNYNTWGRKADGSIWGWGNNSFGQLGNDSIISRSSPVSVVGGHSFAQITGGYRHVVGRKADGSVWAWGLNDEGMLGDGTTARRSSPVSVIGGHLFTTIAAYRIVTHGIKSGGSVWGWGNGSAGHVGDNTTANRSSPVSVVGGHMATRVRGAFIEKADGSLWKWGTGGYGALGQGNSTVNRSSPVSVVGASSVDEFGQSLLGGWFIKDYLMWSWGRNNFGQVGDNTTNNRSSPVSVVGRLFWDSGIGDGIESAGSLTRGGLKHVGVSYNLYDSGTTGELDMSTPVAQIATSNGNTIQLPAISCDFTGLRYVALRAVLDGVEEGSLQILEIEYENGQIVKPRPPRPILSSDVSIDGLSITVKVAISTAEQKAAATLIELFVTPWGSAPNYNEPAATKAPNAARQFVSQTSITATVANEGLYNIAVRTRSADNVQSDNTDVAGPYELGETPLDDPAGEARPGI